MRRASKETALNITAQCIAFAVNLGISFFLTPYITKMLGKDVYGFVGLAYQVTTYISVFTVAFNTMLNVFVATEYYRGEVEKANRFFTSVLYADTVLAILLAAPMLLLSLRMELVLHLPEGSMWDIKLLWIFIFAIFLLNLAYGPFGVGMFLKNRMDLSALRNIESNLLKAVILIALFAFFRPQVWFIGFASFASGILIIVTNIYYHKKLTPEVVSSKERFDFASLKELLAVGIWNTINQLTTIMMNGLDLIVSNLFIGSLGMGYISYAQTVPNQIMFLIAVVKNTLMPRLTKVYAMAKDGMEDFVREVEIAMQICGFLGSVPILLFLVFGRDFYGLWIPTLTVEEVDTINRLAMFILLPSVLEVYISPLYNVNSITKKIKIPVFVSFFMSIANIILELALLKATNLGIYSIEIATAVLLLGKLFLFTPIYAADVLSVSRKTFYRPLLRGGINSLLCFAAFMALRSVFVANTWFRLILIVGIGLVIGYGICFFVVLKKQTRREVYEKVYHLIKR